jgi:predicted site-specific integrase-resolvase
MVNLSPKAMRFTVEALEYRISAYEQQLERTDLQENESSDLTNDLMFLESLLQDFKKALEIPAARVF